MKNMKRYIAVALSLVFILSCMNAPTASTLASEKAGKQAVGAVQRPKISPELEEVLSDAEKDELIPVFIFRKLIPDEKIQELVAEEVGMNTEVYEDSALFDSQIAPDIAEKVEKKLGNEKAHKVDPETQLSPVDQEISEEVDRFIEAKRSIVKREYTNSNAAFAKQNIKSSRKVMYNSSYTTTLAVEATPAEIKAYAELKDVEQVMLYEEYVDEPNLNIIHSQVGTNITKSTIYNGGLGFKGAGIKVGIMEAGSGIYDPNSPHLRGIPSSQLMYVPNTDASGMTIAPVIASHATKVTEIIVGQAVTIGGMTFEGVVPQATVYQTPVRNSTDVFNGFQILANRGVSVINYSAGSDSTGYPFYDQEIDRLIATTNVSFVPAAGNSGGNIGSPAKAINAVTVGNAATKTAATTAAATPFAMAASTSYIEPTYLPNKPDISAPGTQITTVLNATQITSGSGTSFAAPIITGVMAQTMQRNATLKTNPYAAKAFLLLCVDQTKISTANNTAITSYLRDKSGAGLVSASKLLNGYAGVYGTFTAQGSAGASAAYNYTAGQRIRAVLVFGKSNNLSITSTANMDDIDLFVINSAGSTIASSSSSRNNVEIIEFTIPATGAYNFVGSAYRVMDSAKGVPFAIYWMVI